MNAVRLQQQIQSLRAEMAERLDALERAIVEESSDAPPPALMRIAEYAKHANVSVTTVKRWLDAGLPCRRRGRAVRIKVAEADAWCEADTIESSAKREAHRGGL